MEQVRRLHRLPARRMASMVSLSLDGFHNARAISPRRPGMARRFNWRLASALLLNTGVWAAGLWMVVAHIP
jgi:hypothetical protein